MTYTIILGWESFFVVVLIFSLNLENNSLTTFSGLILLDQLKVVTEQFFAAMSLFDK